MNAPAAIETVTIPVEEYLRLLAHQQQFEKLKAQRESPRRKLAPLLASR